MTKLEDRTAPELPGYQFNRLIGLGGMGEVHLATQVALNRQVAVKFLTRTAGDPPEEYEARFRREAELMARISHPNVVTIFDFGAVAGRPYLVMEYVEGGDLRSRMVPDLPMEVGEIRAILKPVFKAVGHLHSRGIVHRDLKPENILMLHDETPKVTDFGIAVLDFAMGSLTRTGRSLGTPGYVAPEQQYGLKVDARADQFSLAALGYEMATGRKPLGAFPRPEKLNPKLGPKAGAVILRGLSEDPTDRFATVGEFGEALDRALEGAEIGSPSKGRLPLVSAAVALAVIAAIPIVSSFLARPAAPTPKVSPAIDAGAVPANVPAPASVPDVAKASPKMPERPARLTARSVGMTLVDIPAGEFWMGSLPGEAVASSDEFPRHLVKISRPFYLGETEVTVAQFRTYIQATGNKPLAENKGVGGALFNVKLNRFEQRPDLNWKNPGLEKPQGDDEPVVQVSWYDAVAFCNWLSERENRRFRLPTEAEWEYACRAGSQARWCFGDDPAQLDQFAWTLRNAGQVFHRVGTKKANAFGLFDMHGNAWEWCFDEYGPYDEGTAIDPRGPRHRAARVLRGGSFDFDNVERTRSASRHHYPPYMSYLNYGFRVCSPEP